MQIWASEIEPIWIPGFSSRAEADRKDEFFRFSVSPFCTQPRSIKATFLHGALIYFSPLHNAARAVRCMNKERESLSLCLSLVLDSKARSISKIMDTSRGDQRRLFLTMWNKGLFGAEDWPNILFIRHWQFFVVKKMTNCSGLWLTASPGPEEGWGQCVGGRQT